MNKTLTFFLSSLLAVSLLSCGNGASNAKGCEPVDSVVYYVYDDPRSDCEDVILQLTFSDGQVVEGYYWGTSDEFSDEREGFYPGFFVQQIGQIAQSGDQLTFVLDTRTSRYFSGPLAATIHTSDEALQQGYHLWIQNEKYFQDCVRFSGTFRTDGLTLRNGKYADDDRFFKIVPQDSLKNFNRHCAFEPDNRKP